MRLCPKIGHWLVDCFCSSSIFSFLINFNVIISCLSFLIGFKVKISNSNKGSIQIEVLKTVLQSLTLALFSIGLVATWTLTYRSTASCWMMNTARQFYRNRNGLGGTRQKSLLFNLIVNNIASAVLVGLLTVAFTPAICHVTPPHFIHAILFPSEHFSIPFNIFCCIYMVTTGVFIASRIAKLLFYICAILYESQLMLRTAYSPNPLEPRSIFQKAVKTQHQSFLFIKEYCTFGFAFLPFIMALGICINIVATLVCIKFHFNLPPILTFLFGGFDIAALVVEVGLYAFAMAGPEESEKFVSYWKISLMKKVERKQLKG